MSTAINNDSLPRDKGHKNKADDDKDIFYDSFEGARDEHDIDHNVERRLEELNPAWLPRILDTSTLRVIRGGVESDIQQSTKTNFEASPDSCVEGGSCEVPTAGKKKKKEHVEMPLLLLPVDISHGSAGAENPVPPLSLALCMRQVRFACRVSPSLCLVSCITPCMCMQKTKLQEIRGPNSSHASLLFLEFPFVLFFRHTSKYQNKKGICSGRTLTGSSFDLFSHAQCENTQENPFPVLSPPTTCQVRFQERRCFSVSLL